MKIVIKIGGSLSIDEKGPRKDYFRKILPVLKAIKSKNQLVVCIGGGKFIRNYFKSIETLGLKKEEMEWIAIELLRVNVRFLSLLLKMKPIHTLEEIVPRTEGIIAGIKPGRSTDANAAYAAARIKADLFIKLTDVDGVYQKDPKNSKSAKKLDRIPFSELHKYSKTGTPGSYGILDRLAMETITRNKIKTIVMSGKNPEDIFRAIKGERVGTLIAD